MCARMDLDMGYEPFAVCKQIPWLVEQHKFQNVQSGGST